MSRFCGMPTVLTQGGQHQKRVEIFEKGFSDSLFVIFSNHLSKIIFNVLYKSQIDGNAFFTRSEVREGNQTGSAHEFVRNLHTKMNLVNYFSLGRIYGLDSSKIIVRRSFLEFIRILIFHEVWWRGFWLWYLLSFLFDFVAFWYYAWFL